MSRERHFTSVTFRNYKAFRSYALTLGKFNVLVGANNSGKSTIIGAFRVLAEGIKKASSRNPEFINRPWFEGFGYRVPLDDLPVATENVFFNYDDSTPAIVEFRISNGNKLRLTFPEPNQCFLTCETMGRPVRSTTEFRKSFAVPIGYVPILGPVEHHEPLFQKETARRSLMTHRAARNFRNIWHHYKDHFDEFRQMVKSTWPGMDIEEPRVNYDGQEPTLSMFCPESRVPREIFWAGFGFQVWCQMLTYMVSAKEDSILLIDEPDIYLHADLQRQLVGLLRNLGPDILIATHSTEIVSEVEPGELVLTDKNARSGKRIQDITQVQRAFNILGSNLNPTLTQLSKTKRAIFVEGKDFKIFSAFARLLGKIEVANRSRFAVIPTDGFNPRKVSDFSQGVEATLGYSIRKAVIFDRDYRSEDECKSVLADLSRFAEYAHILDRKEIENYFLVPTALDLAVQRQLRDANRRGGNSLTWNESAAQILEGLTDRFKPEVYGQFHSTQSRHEKEVNRHRAEATISAKILARFDLLWKIPSERFKLISGKELLSEFNRHLQEKYKVSVTALGVVSEMKINDVPNEIIDVVNRLDEFSAGE